MTERGPGPGPTRGIDLSADLGEGCPWDAALLARVTSASVGCGAHAGGAEDVRATLREAAARGVVVGAHPGYPDRERFGRAERDLSAEEVERLVVDQVDWLGPLAAEAGVPIRFLKPHGALYNQAQRSAPHAVGVAMAAVKLRLPILCLPGSLVGALTSEAGLPAHVEGFADRGYRDDGSLIPRGEPGAILDDPATIAAQVLRLVDRGVATLCLHGDDARSVGLADVVRGALDRAGVPVRPFVVGPRR